jgi:XTP/dITP diphosphohydrolase
LAKIKVVFASNNKGKIHELQTLTPSFVLDVIPQTYFNIPDVEETALSFVENALLKARHAAKIAQMPAIADDSGLEVYALRGKPGIYSARYAGKGATAQDNIRWLLQNLESIPNEQRRARFYCALVYLAYAEDPTPLICEGSWEGSILKAPQGNQGFGYDPIFYVESEKCSAAELSLAKKNQLSHRGQALQLLLKKLPEKMK